MDEQFYTIWAETYVGRDIIQKQPMGFIRATKEQMDEALPHMQKGLSARIYYEPTIDPNTHLQTPKG